MTDFRPVNGTFPGFSRFRKFNQVRIVELCLVATKSIFIFDVVL